MISLDLTEIIRNFSLSIGADDSIGIVLLATLIDFVALGIWGLSRALSKKTHVEVEDIPSIEIEETPPIVIRGGSEESQPIIEAPAIQAIAVPEISKVDPIVERQQIVEEALAKRLSKTRSGFFEKLKAVFSSKPKLDAEMLEELEYLLITSDLGVKTVTKLIDEVKDNLQKGVEVTEDLLIDQLKGKLHAILGDTQSEILETLQGDRAEPMIVLMVGVNGVGKTTTCAKLAARLSERSLKVLLVAADTFRAAAVEQLKSWGERLSVPVFTGAENSKPQAVVFDAMVKAKAEKFDVILIDTAGRLHTKSSLMQELEGVRNTISRHFSEGPQEVILVVDGSTGQNALNQAREFNEAVKLTGLVVTKLDGTPKGGIVVAIKEELGVPVRYIGVGESHVDLRPFQTTEFVDALFDRSATSFDEKVSAHGETRRRRRRGDDLPQTGT